MELSSDVFLEIIESLRDQTGSQIKEAEEIFNNIKTYPETLIKLIELLNSSVEPAVKKTSIILMKASFRSCSSSLSEEFISTLKTNILNFLTSNKDTNTASILIDTTVAMYKIIPWEWPEIIDFVFNLQGPLSVVLQILSELIIPCYPDQIMNNTVQFSNILVAGLKSTANFDKARSIMIMNRMVKLGIVTEHTFVNFVPIVSNILQEVLLRKNDDEINYFFAKFLHDDIFFLFPIEVAYDPLKRVMESTDAPVVVRESTMIILNSYLLEYFNMPQEIIDLLEEIFQLGIQITNEILQNQQDEYYEIVFKGIFLCLGKREDGFDIAFQFANALIEENTVETISIALNITWNIIQYYHDNIDHNALSSMFVFICESLECESSVVRHYASQALTKSAKFLGHFISANLVEVAQRAVDYLESCEDGFTVGSPLVAVLRSADNINELVDDVFRMCLERVQEHSPEPQSQEFIVAINTIVKRMENFSESVCDILQALVETISSDLGKFYPLLTAALNSMSYLLGSEAFEPTRQAIVEHLLGAGLASDDDDVVMNTLTSINSTFFDEMYTEDESHQLSEQLRAIIESCYDESGYIPGMSKKLSAALCAYLLMNKIEFSSEVLLTASEKLSDIIDEKDLEDINNVFTSINCFVSDNLTEPIQNREIIMSIFNSAMDVLKSEVVYTPISVISYISRIISKVHDVNYNLIAENFIRILGLVICFTEENISDFKSHIAVIIGKILDLCDSEANAEFTQQILEIISPHITSDIEDVKLSTISVFLQLLSGLNCEAIPTELLDSIKEGLLEIISQGSPINVVQLISGMQLTESVFNPEQVSILFNQEFNLQLFGACQARFSSGEPDTSSAISMREYLVSLICILSSSYLGDNSPDFFDYIIAVSPITKNSSCANIIYPIIPTLSLVVPIEKQVVLMKKLIPAFALPIPRLLSFGLTEIAISVTGIWMRNVMETIGKEQAESILVDILGEDQLALAYFNSVINFIDIYNQRIMASFERIDVNSLEVIDLTGANGGE